MSKSALLKSHRDQHRKHRMTSIKIRVDKILHERIEQDYRVTRLRRNCSVAGRELIFAEVLTELESSGAAMRYLNYQGRIAWKATPQLRDYLNDLKLDAEAELKDIDV